MQALMEPLHGGRVSPGGAIGAEGTSDADDSRSSRVATETDFVRAAHASVDSASRLMYRAGAVFLGFSWDLSMQYAMWHAFHVGSCFFGRFVLVKRAAALLACLYHTIARLISRVAFEYVTRCSSHKQRVYWMQRNPVCKDIDGEVGTNEDPLFCAPPLSAAAIQFGYAILLTLLCVALALRLLDLLHSAALTPHREAFYKLTVLALGNTLSVPYCGCCVANHNIVPSLLFMY